MAEQQETNETETPMEDSNTAAPSPDRAAQAIWQMRSKNIMTAGTLTVHYVHRDVRLELDGDAALRTIATWTGQTECVDHLDPVYSSASAGWVGIDLSHVVGMTWVPGSVPDRGRITIDPLL